MIKRVLILEDDLETLSKIINALAGLENKSAFQSKLLDLSVTVLSEYTQVEDYINKLDKNYFDLILLDRDCKVAGSFHVLDIEKFGPEKIISISSIPQYNEDVKQRGVTKVVLKEYRNLDNFTSQLVNLIQEMIMSQV